MSSPWEIMRPKLKELGYSDEQIDDMTLAELFELIDNIIEELCED
jgi:broad-specificity NMP kinase